MQIYRYEGEGEYSVTFGWDNGMSYTLLEETSFEEAKKWEENQVEYSPDFNTPCLPEEMEEGVYAIFFNDHNGSRNEEGFVIAPDREMAVALLREKGQTWEMILSE